jgi:hypothetical protein
MPVRSITAAIVVITTLLGWSQAAELIVHTDFPGGSGKVVRIDQEKRFISLTPTAHKDRGWACWWHVRVTGLTAGEKLTLEVGPAPWATPDRATISGDGQVWKHSLPGKRAGKQITFEIPVESDEIQIAWGPPFVPEDAERLVAAAAKSCEHAEAFTLCMSRDGKPVPALRISQPGAADAERYGLWIQARQHAWESGSSWVCRGLVEWLVSDDPRAESLRKRSRIVVVPIMDIDNVTIGAGGKEQKPQDHNRDWTDKPYHPAVASAQKEIAEQNAAGRFDLFLDLHNPGANDRSPFFFITPRSELKEEGRRNLDHFLAAAAVEMTGPLKIHANTRESGPQYDKNWKAISKNWVSFHTRPHVVAVTLETAWNTPASTTEGYRQLGRETGLALERYLRQSPRP